VFLNQRDARPSAPPLTYSFKLTSHRSKRTWKGAGTKDAAISDGVKCLSVDLLHRPARETAHRKELLESRLDKSN
jgi:hypothetical protein